MIALAVSIGLGIAAGMVALLIHLGQRGAAFEAELRDVSVTKDLLASELNTLRGQYDWQQAQHLVERTASTKALNNASEAIDSLQKDLAHAAAATPASARDFLVRVLEEKPGSPGATDHQAGGVGAVNGVAGSGTVPPPGSAD